MRISKGLRGAALAVLIASGAAPVFAGDAFNSADEALRRGIGAYKGGLHEEAVPALEYAAGKDEFLAEYYLARIYGDNAGPRTDHAKAFALYQKIADEHADADPDDAARAMFVGKSLTALARYLKTGLPDIDVKADPARAAAYLRHAALFFRNEDAQFELAKMQLNGDGEEGDAGNAKHWLSVLSQKGHPGAQAFLADLYWRGEHMERDPMRALLLATLAVTSAPLGERVWIEDIHQSIFCGASAELREQAAGHVADWRKRYGRKSELDHPLETAFDLRPQRTCGDREPVVPLGGEPALDQLPVKSAGATEAGPFLKGSAASDAVRDIGTSLAPRETP